jgi:23S rRNA (guanosine2251-2'-O)-methyltransferase
MKNKEYTARRRLRPEAEEDDALTLLEGRNAVAELLRSDKPCDKLFVAEGTDGRMGDLVAQAREKGVPVIFCDRRKLDHMSVTGNHQGVIAQAAAHTYAELDDLLEAAKQKNEPPLLVLCDGIEDPHNLGAIIRSAEAAGAHGVIIPKRRASGLTAVAARASAGALEHIGVHRAVNLAATIDRLKEKGVWVFGAEADGTVGLYEADFAGPTAIVIGSEGEGISRLVRQKCDFIVSIPLRGKVNSLNASNAAAVLLYEAVRRRITTASGGKA